MYTKVFRSIYDGTLADNWKAMVTFQQFLILANEQGVVDMTPSAMSRTTGIPLDILSEGIAHLESPDGMSRTPDMEGRRIVRLDPHRPWGWFLVNFNKYNAMRNREEKREADRVRIADKREAAKVAECRELSQGVAESRGESQGVARCRKVSQGVANVAPTDTDTDVKLEASIPDGMEVGEESADASLGEPKATPIDRTPHAEIVDAYHEELQALPRVRVWDNARKSLLRSRWREDKSRQSVDWWRDFFRYVASCPFLTGNSGGGKDREPFLADLEWLIRPQNFRKVIEGRYEPRGQRL